MKKILSLSLWGNNPKYTEGALRNIELSKDIYPGWAVRIYTDQSAYDFISDNIQNSDDISHVELINYKNEGDWNGMFWRFLPAFDPSVDVMISRDCDSRISKREADAVNHWLDSEKDFHVMRDHPFHNIQVLGGMWGCRNNIMSKTGIKNINPDSYESHWQIDQHFLRHEVYPYITDDLFVHDPYKHFPQELCIHDFPSNRENNHFIGEIFDENNNRHPDHYTLL